MTPFGRLQLRRMFVQRSQSSLKARHWWQTIVRGQLCQLTFHILSPVRQEVCRWRVYRDVGELVSNRSFSDGIGHLVRRRQLGLVWEHWTFPLVHAHRLHPVERSQNARPQTARSIWTCRVFRHGVISQNIRSNKFQINPASISNLCQLHSRGQSITASLRRESIPIRSSSSSLECMEKKLNQLIATSQAWTIISTICMYPAQSLKFLTTHNRRRKRVQKKQAVPHRLIFQTRPTMR